MRRNNFHSPNGTYLRGASMLREIEWLARRRRRSCAICTSDQINYEKASARGIARRAARKKPACETGGRAVKMREMMFGFLENQLDFILFFYRLALILLGTVCLSIAREFRGKGSGLTLVGTFGLIHGAGDWMDLAA
jgi:hypothetical protein